LKAHWGVIAGAGFFTTAVWTWRGLVTYYAVFVIDRASRRVEIVGSTPHPTELFMQQVMRRVTAADDGILVDHRMLICDRDWGMEPRRATTAWRRRHPRGPDTGARPERECSRRAIRSAIKGDCLDRVIPLGERHFRRAITECVEHDHLERNHQGLDNRLITGTPAADRAGPVRRRSRLGGLLNYYERAA
jgi:hypothetical protein